MDAWIDFAAGPLFRISLAVLVLGLIYRFVVLLGQVVTAWRQAGDRRLPVGTIAGKTLKWIVPVRLFHQKPVFSFASVLFHVGIILVPLFLAGHVALLSGFVPEGWPVLGPLAADVLTIVALVGIAILGVMRLTTSTSRGVTQAGDLAILAVLFLLVLFGFFASHPELSPLGARWMVLLHILLGDLALILTPTTKIAHCVLFPLTQLVAALAWRYPEASGRNVMVALGKENETV